MGLKQTFNKLIGQSGTDDPGATGGEKKQDVAAVKDINPVAAAGDVHAAQGSAVEQESVV